MRSSVMQRSGGRIDDEKRNPTGSGLVRETIRGRTVEYYG